MTERSEIRRQSRKTAQVSFETMVGLGIVMLIFTLLIFFSYERKGDIADTKDAMDARKECMGLANLITETFVAGDGSRVIKKFPYNATIQSSAQNIMVENEGQEWYCSVPVANMTDGTSSVFNVTMGFVRVRNQNGIMVIDNV